jgi:hypothetical protein
MGTMGRARVEEMYGVGHLAGSLLAVYREAAESAGVSRVVEALSA